MDDEKWQTLLDNSMARPKENKGSVVNVVNVVSVLRSIGWNIEYFQHHNIVSNTRQYTSNA